MLAALVLAGCGHTDRPEGIVERWFTSLNQGSAGRPGQYAPELLSQGVLPNWRKCEPGALDVVEVGRGEQAIAIATIRGPQYLVPYRIEYVDDRAELCDTTLKPDVTPTGVAVLELSTAEGPWRVAAALPQNAVEQDLPLPSEGGPPVAKSGASLWAVGLLIGVVLCGLVAILMRAMPRPAPVPSEPLDPSEARGL
jgi:hypothetical protein